MVDFNLQRHCQNLEDVYIIGLPKYTLVLPWVVFPLIQCNSLLSVYLHCVLTILLLVYSFLNFILFLSQAEIYKKLV